MTSVGDISMFDSSFGLQSTNNQPHLDNFEDYSFVFDAANNSSNCSHRELQEVLPHENPAIRMTNMSKGHAQQIPALQSSSYDTYFESLKMDIIELKREIGAREKKVKILSEMLASLFNTVTKQGIAIKKMIVEMSPERSESFSRGFREELRKLPTNTASKA